ncbi:fungal-specific transcription factor domain-containing protein [Verticillium dahliae]|nr:fungal-specific transcription factor domain-containing protein [Verticillium dahliae]
MRRELHSCGTSRVAHPPTSAVQEILATMVALCYSEAFIPGSKNWNIHLRACRTIIDLQHLPNENLQPLDPVQRFLLKEVADLETLSNISVFSQGTSASHEPPLRSIYDGSFWAFTGLVYEITTEERRRHRALQMQCRHGPEVNMAQWRRKIDEAYNTLSTSCPFSAEEVFKQQSLDAVLKAHYASLIYSHQAFAPADKVSNLVSTTLDPLLQEMHSVLAGPTQALSHDLFFPLFIAGTECRGDKQRQAIVEQLYLTSLSTTGLWFNNTSLQFLQVFWASTTVDTECWIQFARENEARLGTFIAF